MDCFSAFSAFLLAGAGVEGAGRAAEGGATEGEVADGVDVSPGGGRGGGTGGGGGTTAPEWTMVRGVLGEVGSSPMTLVDWGAI